MASSDPESVPKSGITYVDGLVSGNRWNVDSGPVTYSFHDDGLSGAADFWLTYEKEAFRQALQFWSDVSNVTFQELDEGTDANFDLYITSSRGFVELFGVNALGAGFGPSGSGLDGLLVYNWQTPSSSETNMAQGSLGFAVAVHEVGHILGLDHPHDQGASGNSEIFPGVDSSGDTGLFDMNQGIWTTMSYNTGWPIEAPTPSLNYGLEGTPMALDVAAVQHIYGANMTHNTGDDTYELPTTNGVDTHWASIWDAGGSDEISARVAKAPANIDLREAPLVGPNAGGYVSFIEGIFGGFTVANGVVIESAIGGPYDDTITGNQFNNTLFGHDGNDRLSGGPGDNSLDGGRGRDWAYYRDATAAVTVDLTAGTASGDDRNDLLTSIERVSGSRFDDKLVGNSLNNYLRGHDGDDQIIGRGGNDTLEGGDGNDTLRAGSGDDSLDGGGGQDWAYYRYATAAVSVDLTSGTASDSDGIDTLVSIERAHGTLYGDILIGDAQNNVLKGDDGDDRLFGRAGNDVLEGGGDQDRLYGGPGDDSLDGGQGRDWAFYRDATAPVTVNLAAGTVSGGGGTDTLTSIERIHGSRDGDTIVGDAKNNILRGDEGDDRLFGLDGADILQGLDDQDRLYGGPGDDSLEGGQGRDWAFYRDAPAAVTVNLAAGTASGGGGNDTLTSIERVHGSRDDDTLRGDAKNNILRGDEGNDALYGLAGNDRIEGGADDDRIEGGAGNDDLYGGEGDDLFILGAGDDSIGDFDAGDLEDALAIGDVFADVDDALANATQVGNNTVFNYTAGSTILIDVLKADLGEDDFVLGLV